MESLLDFGRVGVEEGGQGLELRGRSVIVFVMIGQCYQYRQAEHGRQCQAPKLLLSLLWVAVYLKSVRNNVSVVTASESHLERACLIRVQVGQSHLYYLPHIGAF